MCLVYKHPAKRNKLCNPLQKKREIYRLTSNKKLWTLIIKQVSAKSYDHSIIFIIVMNVWMNIR